MTKRILLSLILWGGVVFSSLADNATVDGIYYSLNSSLYGNTATVAYDATISAAYVGDIVIPSTIVYSDKTYTVTTIAGKAFQNSTGLTSIVIPESIASAGFNTYTFDGCTNLSSVTINNNNVTAIPKYFFQNCSSLTGIIIPTSVTTIGDYAFNGCSDLATVSILGNVTSIGEYAFQDCSALTSMSLPESVTTLGKYAFSGCSSLASINIPSNVTTINASLFASCSELTSIIIPSGVTTIAMNAFNGCSKLSSVNIPSGVTAMNMGVFSGCSSLTSIVIPASVTTYSSNVFLNCTGLKEICICNSTPSSIYTSVFQNVPKNIPVYVPSASISAYQTATNWSSFTNYKDLIEYTSSIVFYNGETLNTGIILLTGSGSVTIQNGGKVRCDNILGATPENLIIEDGGQLAVNSSGVQATFQKEIEGYTNNKDRYYLIANPTTTNIAPSDVENMLLANKYDLFYFDESEEGAEWRNYKQEPFDLENGKGYLYANDDDVTLAFVGTAPTGTSASITLNKTDGNTYAGFNLVGNPMSVNITSMYIGDSECSYYKLNPTTGVFSASTATIIVGEAFMVQADENGATLNLNPGSKDESSFNNEVIRLEVSNNKYTDVAYLYFGNHLPLTKINHLNDEAPMLYIHSEKADQAVAVINNRSEVKSVNVNFEAKVMGSYTISGKAEKGNFSYMHLYDRLTGTDTDLLNTDYTFIGSKTDAAGRFILRFEAIDNNSESESFAYQNGSDIIINGEGELQIFDVMGRMVSTKNVNGRETINVSAQGVYIFRLNGMTQKIVVK